ncbi:nuclear transport factor 2 family protein, partial [Streptomyces sp. SID11233]|nr:nuclear transport factor 2 family protein [Streptomyces sp. SID11233]
SPASAAPHGPEDAPSRITAMTATRLAPDLVHLRWDTDDGERTVHRASLWRRAPGSGEWLLWFHQGTPYASDDDTT